MTMKDVVGLKLNPGGPVAIYKWCEKGLAPITCVNRSVAQTKAVKSKDDAKQHSAAARNLSKAPSLLASNPREPSSTFEGFKKFHATWCAKVRALFGDGCDHYVQCYILYKILLMEQVEALESHFTGDVICLYVWAVTDDARYYFAQIKRPDDLMPGKDVEWPKSLLADIFPLVRRAQPVEMANFPHQWRSKSKGDRNQFTFPPQGWGGPAWQPPRGLPPHPLLPLPLRMLQPYPR